MYLQVVHYYDQKHKDAAAIIHASVQKGWEKPAKTKGAKKVCLFIPNCYTDHNQMRPLMPMSISAQTLLVLTACSAVEGKTAACPGTSKPEETALHANNHSEPLSATRMILTGFSFCLLIHICVRVYV